MQYYMPENINKIFNTDVRDKKRIAGQARHRKCGSKSKRCVLSTDGMTRKQWIERCGEPVTYTMNKPVSWEEFSTYPKRIQKEYLEGLIGKYATTATDLAKMFNVTPPTISKLCGNEEIGIRFSAGKRMNKEQRDAFNRFLNPCEEMIEECTEPVAEEQVEMDEECDDMSRASSDMAMTEFTLSFQGKFNRDMICNSLLSMVKNGTNVKIDIRCCIEQ